MLHTDFTEDKITNFAHQDEALKFIKNKQFFALFMEQGTGKTRVIIKYLKNMFDEKILDSLIVISPNAVKEQWIEELKIHYNSPFAYHVWNGCDTKKERNDFFDVLKQTNIIRVFIINVEAFQSNKIDEFVSMFLKSCSPLVVVDESTKIKNPEAKRTIKIQTLCKYVKYKAILSGTPTPNSPFDLYSQFNFLMETFFKTSFWQFKNYHGILLKAKDKERNKDYTTLLTEKIYNFIKFSLSKIEDLTIDRISELAIKYGTTERNIVLINTLPKYTAFKNLEILYDKIKPYTFSSLKKDCLDLPEKVYERLTVEMTIEQKTIYKNLIKDLEVEYMDKKLTVKDSVSIYMRLQMISGGLFPYSDEITKKFYDTDGNEYLGKDVMYKTKVIENNSKIKALLEDLETVSADTQIIIWSVFVEEIKMITEKLLKAGYSVCCYYGAVNLKSRPQIIQDFKDKIFQILVINPSMGGEGLNLQVSTLHYFYSNLYRADVRLQAEDRSHRIGQKNNVLYKDIVNKNTIDEKILRVLKGKENLIDFFRDKSLHEILY